MTLASQPRIAVGSSTMTHSSTPGKLLRPDGETIAYLSNGPKEPVPGRPGLVWLGGLKSDMTGTKATALADWADRTGRAFVRFDYFAHGASSGEFFEGTIGRWAGDALEVLDVLTDGPQILVGSSMGGWLSLLTALARPKRIAGLVLIAPAPDFTEELMWRQFSPEIRDEIMRDGVYHHPSDYDEEPYPITRRFIEEGREHLLLGGPIPLTCPVRLLHGMADTDVPWRHSLRLIEALQSEDVNATFTKSGDHRLSEPADLKRLTDTLDGLCTQLEATSHG